MNKLPEELFESIPPTPGRILRELKYLRGKVPYEELKEIINLQDKEFLISLGNSVREWIHSVTFPEDWDLESGIEREIFINKQMLENFCYEYGWELDDLLEAASDDYNDYGL